MYLGVVVSRRNRPTRASGRVLRGSKSQTHVGKEYIKAALLFQSLFTDTFNRILVCSVGLLYCGL